MAVRNVPMGLLVKFALTVSTLTQQQINAKHAHLDAVYVVQQVIA